MLYHVTSNDMHIWLFLVWHSFKLYTAYICPDIRLSKHISLHILKRNRKGIFYISGFSLILQPASSSLGEKFRLYSHLQHFLKVPIQIPTRIISSLHSDVLPFILALYYCQLSPVLGKRRKRISSAFPLLGHFTEVVSPYRLGALQNLLNVTPAEPQDTMAACSLSCYFQL